MKVRVEGSMKAVGDTTVLHAGTFDTDVLAEGEKFLDLLETFADEDNFIEVKIWKLP